MILINIFTKSIINIYLSSCSIPDEI